MARRRDTENYKPDDDGRSRFTVRHNKWDRQDYNDVRREVQKVPAATDALAEITGEDVARAEGSDAFMLFMKASPDFEEKRDITDFARISLAVNQQLKEVEEFQQLRRFTRGDLVGSAMAFARIEPTLETLYDRLEKEREQANKLDQLRKELAKAIREKMKQEKDKEDGDPQDSQGQPGGSAGSAPESTDLDDLIEDLQERIEEAEKALQEALDDQAESMQAELSEAMGGAIEDAANEQASARAWGLEPGQLMKLPADVRLKLAAKMNQDRLRRISELFGPMHNLAIAPRQRRVEDIPHEIKRVTLGKDLAHLVAKELSAFNDEDLEMDFLKRYVNGSLMQYKMDGTEKVGKGGLVVCLDSSGSMQGSPELMSKAVMLTLLNICKKDNREFYLIHFGSPGLLKEFSFRTTQDFSPDKVISAAETFMNSGTDFVTPLNRAIELLEQENARTGRVRSDIVFLTDGECGVPKGWTEKFHEKLHKLDAACWGIAIGCSPHSQPLTSICEGQVCAVTDLQNSGKEIKTIFSGVMR